MKITPGQAVKIGWLIARAIREVAAEVKEARDPGSDRGRTVTFQEALEIVQAALGASAEPIAAILADE